MCGTLYWAVCIRMDLSRCDKSSLFVETPWPLWILCDFAKPPKMWARRTWTSWVRYCLPEQRSEASTCFCWWQDSTESPMCRDANPSHKAAMLGLRLKKSFRKLISGDKYMEPGERGEPTVKEGVPAADPYKSGDKKHQKALVLKDLDLTTVNYGSIVSSTMESRRVSPTSKVQYKTWSHADENKTERRSTDRCLCIFRFRVSELWPRPCSHFPMWAGWWCQPLSEWSQRKFPQSDLATETSTCHRKVQP